MSIFDIHFINSEIDNGDIVEINKCKITKDDTGQSLYEKVSKLSISLFNKYHNKMINKETINRYPQEKSKGKYYDRKLPHNGILEWHWESKKIFDFCRALYFKGYNPAKALLNLNEIDIFSLSTTTNKSTLSPGKIVKEDINTIVVSTSDFDVNIKKNV